MITEYFTSIFSINVKYKTKQNKTKKDEFILNVVNVEFICVWLVCHVLLLKGLWTHAFQLFIHYEII